MATTTLAPDVRGVMIPVTDTRVLLPNACISEVITYGHPQEFEDAPDWVLGAMNWRGWRLPLFSFSSLIGLVPEEDVSGAKVAILKAFSAVHTMPYIGMLAQGFPRLTAVTSDTLQIVDSNDPVPEGAVFRVVVEEEEGTIPDLDMIESALLPLIRGGREAA